MGTFASYIGKVSIPEEKKDEFNKNMIRLLQFGGMVDFNRVSMYNKEIYLISPVSLKQNGKCSFHYSYFEDDPWEDAGFDSNRNLFESGKIGSDEFNFVICAAYFLTELYSEGPGYVSENGEILNNPGYVQWINFILDKDFSLEKRLDLWELYESYVLSELRGGYSISNITLSKIMEFVPNGYEEYMGGTELADILYIMNGTEIGMDYAKAGSYAKEILDLKNELSTYYSNHALNGKEKIMNLITLSFEQRKQNIDEDLDMLAEISLRVAARVFVYLSAEILKFSFWDEWKDVHETVYSDEVIPNYVANSVAEKRKEGRSSSLGKMKTSEFLKNDDYFTFYRTPEEIKDKENYYISDDDLMYWWEDDGKVELSDKMIKQIHKWKEDYDEILKSLSDEVTSDYDMLKKLLDVLDSANDYYRRIYAFQDMFYEFIEHSKDARYIALVRLFEKVIEENKEAGGIIKYAQGRWEMVSKNVTFNEGRVTIKRFLGFMANRRLRNIYFGF